MSKSVPNLQFGLNQHQQGNLAKAEKVYREVIRAQPRNADALHLLGVLCSQTRRTREGLQLLQKAIGLDHSKPIYSVNLAECFRMDGRSEDAVQTYRKVLARHPRFIDGWLQFGALLHSLQRHQEAAEAYQRVLDLQPDNARAMSNMGHELVMLGRAEEAIALFERAVQQDPENVDILRNLGTMYFHAGRFTQAAPVFHEIVRRRPDDPEAHRHFADVLLVLEDLEASERHVRKMVELDPGNSFYHLCLGQMLCVTRKLDEAESAFRKAMELDPGNLWAQHELAIRYEVSNRLDEAQREAASILQKDPQHSWAPLTMAKVHRRLKDHESAVACLRELLGRPHDPLATGSAQVELGHALDGLDRFDEAWQAFETGQRLLSQSPQARPYSTERDLSQMRRMNQWLDTADVTGWPTTIDDDQPTDPVFFVGFPRSGTTLTEQILAAHPDFFPMEEYGILGRTVDQIRRISGAASGFPAFLDELSGSHIRELRRFYWAELGKYVDHASIGGRRLVDKLPLNIRILPVVRRIFPRSKILVAIRDPRDVCLSCFMQEFVPNQSMVQFFSIESTVRYYSEVMSLWLRYREQLGLDWQESRYEDLVENLEQAAREIFRFLEADWHDEVLQYRERIQDKVVFTPSYTAVREPIYKRARHRWLNYRSHLEPFLESLAPFIEAFGYSDVEARA